MSRLEAKTTAGPAVPHPFPYQGEQAGTHQVHPALLPAGHRSLYTPAGLRRGRGSSNPRPPARIDWNGSRRTAAVRPATSSCTGPARLRTTRRDSRRNWRLPLPSANGDAHAAAGLGPGVPSRLLLGRSDGDALVLDGRAAGRGPGRPDPLQLAAGDPSPDDPPVLHHSPGVGGRQRNLRDRRVPWAGLRRTGATGGGTGVSFRRPARTSRRS